MDKKIFLLDKDHYTKDQVQNLTENDLEKWVSEEDYNDNCTILKIDANGYDTPEEALKCEGILYPEDYYQFNFGF